MRIAGYIRSAALEGTQISRLNIISASILGAPAHFVFYFVFKYVFHLPYESFALRIIAVILCAITVMKLKLPDFLGKYFPFFWHAMLIYVLPFIFTVYLLKNNFHELWLYWEIFMIFVLISYVPNWLIFLFDLLAGIVAAVLFFLLTTPDIHLTPDFNIPLYSIVIFFTIVAGYMFSYSNKRGLVALEKNSALQALAGSIAHEMRNPLGQVRYNLEAIEHYLPGYHPGRASAPISDTTLDRIYLRLAHGKLAVSRGIQVINMILDEVKDKPFDRDQFVIADARVATLKAVDEYGFESRRERGKVSVDIRNNFMFRVDETMYVFVLFNLIMNALYFLKSQSGVCITVTLEQGELFNLVKVRDTGPGIPPENIGKLFDPYFTSGKKGGTGLGLSYCKRVMKAFGGDITCDSVLGEYTEFTLFFPKISDDELTECRDMLIAANTAMFEKKRFLVVDDHPADRRSLSDVLVALGSTVVEAEDGRAVVAMLSKEPFDFIVMNLSMPFMNGYEATEKIRKGAAGNEKAMIPIIAYTAAPYHIARVKTEKAGMQGLITKPCSQLELIRQLTRNIEAFRNLKTEKVSGKKVLVTDDSHFNRVAVRSILERWGIEVDEAENGRDAVDQASASPYDLILMDLQMPVCDGIKATREIRASAGHNGMADVPIIGLSGETDEAFIDEALNAGMNDYLVKPVDARFLLQKISQWAREHA